MGVRGAPALAIAVAVPPVGVSANLLYGFERFIPQKVVGDVFSLDADVDEPCGLLYRAVRVVCPRIDSTDVDD